jgi:RNA polymerase sigma-70 factor (ECF subfamily)
MRGGFCRTKNDTAAHLRARATFLAVDAEQLALAFAGGLPAPLGEGVDPAALGAELVALIERARAEAPGVEVDPAGFARHVAERATLDRHGRPVLGSLHAGALWIAFGCVAGQRDAIAAFEQTFAPAIGAALARSFDRGLAQDAELALRERLFLVADDGEARLGSYSGRGDLRAWLRAAAVRTAIDLTRTRRTIAVAPDALANAASTDPLLAGLKDAYRETFRAAFAAAARALTDRERTILRYRFVDDLSIDEIGALFGVHRATVARWLGAIREGLFEATRAGIMAQLELSESEVDSVLRLVDSQLDVSISGVL